ncbi:MAG: DMT family transporter [Betaproteobacteria bacterium]|nr:DMT family transporter [Betaproteobacteria bacterium]NBT11139.1 DMT family transporter [Betaproteobacteria bacterium]NBU50441.1 DMT family transporter [Betaproteobacteria bacterium]NBX95313.1 DMT family transporter [Betaproteobacteria bacterium]
MTERRSNLDATALSGILLCCVLWGINQSVAKAALPEVPPLLQAAVRSLGAALLVWAWSRWRGIALFERDGTLPGGVLAGVLFAGEFAFIFWGLQYTHASRMIVFIYLSPFVVALGMPWITRSERLRPAQWTGLMAAFSGVALAFSEGFGAPAAGPLQWLGDAMGLLAALLWGATTLAIRATRLAQAPAEKALFYQLAVSAPLLGLGAWALDEAWPARWSSLALGSMFFQIVVISFASYLLWFWLIRHYPATRLASFTLLTPLSGLLAGMALLGEAATPRLLVALVAVGVGIWLVNRAPPAAT